jgi:hypothetical protein
MDWSSWRLSNSMGTRITRQSLARVGALRGRVRFMLDDRAREAKRRALSEHRSQLEDRPGGAIVPAHVLDYFSQSYEVFLL